jgi:hypothetical protein
LGRVEHFGLLWFVFLTPVERTGIDVVLEKAGLGGAQGRRTL